MVHSPPPPLVPPPLPPIHSNRPCQRLFTPTREPPRTPRPGVGGLERPAATCADPPREKWRTKKERSPRRNSKCFRTKVHRSPRETKGRRPETTRSDTKNRSHRGRASFRGRSIALEAQTGSRTLQFRFLMDPKTSPKTLRRAPGALPGAPGSPGAPPGTPTSSKVDACAEKRASAGHLGTPAPPSPRSPPQLPYTTC